MVYSAFPAENSLPIFETEPLEESIARFLNWAEPLLDSREYDITAKSAEALLNPAGEIRKLHEELRRSLERDSSLETLRPFWERWYLRHSMELPINLNPYYLFDLEFPSGPALAAHLTVRALEFYRHILDGTLPRDEVKGVPQSMSQYGRIFGCTRLPGAKGDSTFVAEDSLHIVFFRRGRIYSLPVLDKKGCIPAKKDLERLYEDLWKKEEPLALSPGVFTAGKRQEWASLREKLREHSGNRRNLEVLERALFVLVLEDSPGEEEVRFCRNLFGGMPDNRWYDKSLQLIVYPEGIAGWNYEHSCRDGDVMSRFAAFLGEESSEELPCGEFSLVPEPLEFVLTPELEEKAREIRRSNARLRQRVKLEILRYPSFGASELKKAYISPDAFVQLALLGVQRELWGKLRSAFESVSLRHFRNGRTEGTRPLTAEGAACIRAYGEGARKESLAPLLRRAGKAHQDRTRLCQRGKGLDGHLGFLESFALFRGKNPEEIPFFASPGWKLFNEFWMSTSATGGKGIRVAGYGPAVPEGFAVRYVKNPGEIELYLTSFEGDIRAFERAFEKVASDFLEALKSSEAE